MSVAARGLVVIALATQAFVVSGCLTVGRDFPDQPVTQIQIGRTDQAELRRLFGEPFRTGVEDGQQTWTYGYYRYSAFGATKTRDLVLRFDPQGVVQSYSYNTTVP